ncbi:Ig-like domain-containing protein, partial [Patescibacteria group bacterium]
MYPTPDNNTNEPVNQENKQEQKPEEMKRGPEKAQTNIKPGKMDEIKKIIREHSLFVMPVALIFLVIITVVGAAYFIERSNKSEISSIRKNVEQEPQPDLFVGFSKLEISPENADDNFALKPEKQDSAGIDSDASFILTSKEKIETKLIKKIISIEPKDIFVLEEVSGQEWKLVPKEPIEPNTMVKVALATTYSDEQDEKQARDFSWVYQVKDSFKVLHSIPRDAGTNVPTNTGLEITFSHDNFINYEKYFEVIPRAEGRFEKHGRTLVFVPLRQLSAGTIYTMTVKRGLPLQNSSETLAQDYSITFETRPDPSVAMDGAYFSINKKFVETSAFTPPVVQVYSRNLPENRIKVNVFKYSGWQDYLASMRERDNLPWWSYAKEGYLEDTAKLSEIANYTLDIEKSENIQYLEFPEGFPLGFYLVEFSYKDLRRQMWMQISNIAVYYNVTKTDALLWVNDVESKSPAKGVGLELLDTKVKAISNSDGVIRFPTPEVLKTSAIDKKESKRYYYKLSKDSDALILPATQTSRNYYWSQSSIEDDYWVYLYTDRPRYQSNDVIKFWGLLKERDNKKIEDNITVAFNKEGYVDYYYRPIVIKEFEIELSGNNTFEGEIKLENIRPDYYTIELRVGDQVINRKYVNIRPYIKPAYNLTLIADRQYAFADETVNLTAKASFFEGTPVPELKLVYETPNGKETFVTDENGEVHLTYSKKYYECTKGYSCWPEYETVSIRPEDSELAEITGYSYLRFYGTRLYLEKNSDYPD